MAAYLLSVDPGKSTGVTLWSVPDDTPAERIAAWQFVSGLPGFLQWYREHTYDLIEGPEVFVPDGDHRLAGGYLGGRDFGHWTDVVTVISERFTPLHGQGFSLTSDAVEPLRIEGAMIALGLIPNYDEAPDQWQRPAQMYVYGGANLADRKKRARAWLKGRGLLLTGKDVGCRDADDAVSSTLHALAYLRKHHAPTRAHYWKGE